jgi:hypothetical protein
MSFSRRIGATPSINNLVRMSELVTTLWPMMIRSKGFSSTFSAIAVTSLLARQTIRGFLSHGRDLAPIDPGTERIMPVGLLIET